MTMPVEPETGTPAPETGDPSQQPTTGPEETTQEQPETGDNWGSLFEGLTPQQVKRKLDHARRWEDRAKDNKAKLDELTARFQPADGEPTVDDLRKQLDDAGAAREQAETRAVELVYENAVTRAAGKAGADAEALLDSQKFREEVADRLDEDFDDNELRAVVAEVAGEYAKKPRFAVAAPVARSGGDFTGAPGAASSIDQQIADAEQRRDFGAAIALKRHKAALRK